MKSTTPYPEVWIRMFTSSKSRIKVMLDQENDPELDDGWSGYFIPRIFRTMPESTKFGARWEVKFGAIRNCLFRHYSDMNHTPRLRICRKYFAWRMPSGTASLKIMQLLFFLFFTIEKLLSTVNVPGKMVKKQPVNLSRTEYMLWRPFQSSWYAFSLSNMSMNLFS